MSEEKKSNRIDIISKLFSQKENQKILDIGAWKWYYSILAASYHHTVDSIEPNKMKFFQFPNFLKHHPHINYSNKTIQEYTINNNYDIILCLNVIMFLDKDYFLNILLPKLKKHTNPWWYIILNRFGSQDKSFEKPISLFDKEEIVDKKWQEINYGEETINENHPPLWPHTHNTKFLIIKNSTE